MARSVIAQPMLLVQDNLADLRPGNVVGLDWTTTPGSDLVGQFCAATSGASARLMLATQRLTRRQRETCSLAKSGKLVETLIGRRALIGMTSGATFGVTQDILYRALARDVPNTAGKFAPNLAVRWRELDNSLPDAPIRILLPVANSAEDQIVNDVILYDACSVRAGAALPIDPGKRLAICTTLRSDSAVSRITDKQTVSNWLHSQGEAAVALLGIATLLAEPELESALPFDGVAPSFTTIADETYRASLPVWLVSVISPDNAASTAAIVGSLLAESAIGPLGKLPRRGLAPIAAAERVKLRASLGRMLDNAAN